MKNNIVLVTGAAGLLGKVISVGILETGSDLIITDIDENNLEKLKVELETFFPERHILSFVMDVTNKENIKEIFDGLLKKEMFPKVLINNAAVDTKVMNDGTISNSQNDNDLNLDLFFDEMRVGLGGAILCSQEFVSKNCNSFGNNRGVIINIGSIYSVVAPNKSIYPQDEETSTISNFKPLRYSVEKTALVGLTKHMAAKYGDLNIRVNMVGFGGVLFDQSKSFVDKMSMNIPLGRMMKKDEAKGIIKLLISEESSYINGALLMVDGGYTSV